MAKPSGAPAPHGRRLVVAFVALAACASAASTPVPTLAPTPVPTAVPAPLAAADLVVAEHLIPWTPEREALTETYLGLHRTTPLTGDSAADTRMTPQVIVLHWTGGPTAASAWATFAPDTLSGRPELLKGGTLNVGAHYVVERDGRIERLFPEDRVVRHCIGLNHVAIGVENVGGEPDLPLTDAQVEADAALIRDIVRRQPVKWLYGHLESSAIEACPLYEEKDPTYRNAKPDPGAAFMAKVRAKVADLGLAGG